MEPNQKGGSRARALLQKGTEMRFIDLLNRMHCDFFEIQYNDESEQIEFEQSGRMTERCKKYYDCEVNDFYITRSNKDDNRIGLIIRLY